MTHPLRRRLAAALVAAAGLGGSTLVLGAAAPAQAAACSSASGVTVVVDFNGLVGGVQGACVADGGGDDATALFNRAGFPLNLQTPGNPGYVCQVDRKPSGCTPPDGDAYWGLWWSDGTDGSWTYSSVGASSLRIPDGGYVAFAWDEVAGDERPSYAPAERTAPGSSASPSASPSTGPTAGPKPSPTPGPSGGSQPQQPGQSPAGAGQPSRPQNSPQPGSASPSGGSDSAVPGGAGGPTKAAPSTSAPTTAEPTDSAPATGSTESGASDDVVTELADPVTPTSSEAAALDEAGLPGWLAPVVIMLLFAIAGVVLLLRRRPTP